MSEQKRSVQKPLSRIHIMWPKTTYYIFAPHILRPIHPIQFLPFFATTAFAVRAPQPTCERMASPPAISVAASTLGAKTLMLQFQAINTFRIFMLCFSMVLKCMLQKIALILCIVSFNGYASTKQNRASKALLSNILLGKDSPAQSFRGEKPKVAKNTKNVKGTPDLTRDTDHAIKTTEGFAAPSDDDYLETSSSEEDEVDDHTPDLDEDITHLSERLGNMHRGEVFSLQDAFDSVAQSPQALILQQDSLTAHSNAYIAAADLFPDLNTHYYYNARSSKNQQDKTIPKNLDDRHSLGMDMSWSVFNGLRGVNTRRAAEQHRLVALAQQQEGLSRIFLDTVKAYASSVASRNLILAHKRRVALANEALKVALSRHAAGDITRADLKSARSALAKARSELEKAHADHIKSLTGLENLVDMELDDKRLLPVTLPGEFPQSFDACKQQALESNPSIRRADLLIKALEFEKKSEVGRYSPTVTVSASADRVRSRRWNDAAEKRPPYVPSVDLSADVRVVMPIDYKGSITHQARKRVYSLEKERARQRYTRLNILLEVKKVWKDFTSLEKSIKHLESQVKAAAEAWKALREGFKQGSKIGVELLQAERDYIAAEIDLIQTKQERIVQGFTLLHVIGNLNRDTLLSACPFARNMASCKDTQPGGTHDKKTKES